MLITKNYKILITGLILIIVCLFIALNLYNKPFVNIENSNPKLKITAEQLADDFRSNEQLANEKYIDHLILITGEIANISFSNGNSIITLKVENGTSNIICHMLPETNLNTLKFKKGDKIIIKGICSGYLLDVMMVRCILTQENFNDE